KKIYRFFIICLCIGMIGVSITTYIVIPKDFVHINQYQSMTKGCLRVSEEPEKALDFFGINKQYSLLKGGIYYETFQTIDIDSKRMEKDFYHKYNFISLLKYYLLHPKEFKSLLDIGARQSFMIKPNAQGNYEKSVGKPFQAETHFFTLYSYLKEKVSPQNFMIIIIWFVAIFLLYGKIGWRMWKKKDVRGLLLFFIPVLIALILIAYIVIVLICDGEADLSKHEF